MSELKHEFVLGFHEGWTAFWSPFTGLYKALKRIWKTHMRMAERSHHHA